MQVTRILPSILVLTAISTSFGQFDPAFAPQDGPGQPSAAPQQSAMPKPTVTPRPDFYVPFEVAQNTASAAAEVQLYLSTNRGQKWSVYQRLPTTGERFQFSAQADGEYWFAVRTVDRQGKLIAHSGWQPELIVIVDTNRPELNLQVEVDDYGNAKAQWAIQDLTLDPSSFRLQYQDTRSREWKEVQVRTPEDVESGKGWNGNAEWWMQPTGEQVFVRAEVSDQAGNSSEATKRVTLSRVAKTDRDSAEPSRFAESGSPTQVTPPSSNVAGQRTWGDSVNQLREAISPWYSGGGQTTTAAPHKRHNFEPSANAPTRSKIAPPVASQFGGSTATTDGPAVQPKITAYPNFELSYDILDVGPRGARTVELWYTRDEGQTWQKYGADPDAKSPIEVHVDQQGLYGFQLVVYGFDGSPPHPPQDGDNPDIWIGVDWTKPRGRITSIRSATGQQSDTLTIEWLAEDALIGERPISLAYSNSRQGPWTPIVHGIANSGSYDWRSSRQDPRKIFLQIEITDMAGNVTTDVYQQQSQTPKGRIRDIRPLGPVDELGRSARLR